MLRVAGGKFANHLPRQLRIVQAEILAAAEGETGMVGKRASGRAVLAGSENEQILAGSECDVRKNPFAQIPQVIRQRPAQQANSVAAAVE